MTGLEGTSQTHDLSVPSMLEPTVDSFLVIKGLALLRLIPFDDQSVSKSECGSGVRGTAGVRNMVCPQ